MLMLLPLCLIQSHSAQWRASSTVRTSQCTVPSQWRCQCLTSLFAAAVAFALAPLALASLPKRCCPVGAVPIARRRRTWYTPEE